MSTDEFEQDKDSTPTTYYVFTLIHFIGGSVMTFFSILFFFAYFSSKKRKIKEDVLICERSLMMFVIVGFYVFKIIVSFFESDSRNTPMMKISCLLFNYCLFALTLVRLCHSFENYLTFSRPNHFLNSLIYSYSSKPYYELFICTLTGLYIAGTQIFESPKVKSKINFEDIEKKFNITFFIPFSYSWLAFYALLIPTFIFGFLEKKRVNSLSFKSKEKLISVVNKELLITFIYLIYISCYFLGSKFVHVLKRDESGNVSTYFWVGMSTASLVVMGFELAVEIHILSRTKFCLFKLRDSFLGSFAPSSEKRPENNLADENTSSDSSVELSGSLINANYLDSNLIACYNNGIYLEDYHFDFYESIINIAIISILKTYDSNIFEDQNLDFTGGITDHSISPLELVNISDATKLIYTKNKSLDDFKEFQEIFTYLGSNYNLEGALNISVETLYTQDIKKILSQKGLDKKKIKASLYSHVKKAGECFSIMGNNISEEYFRNLHSLTIKTYDKQYLLDIYHWTDSSSPSSTKKLDEMTTKYFDYIQKASGTFLPILVGVFKVKINAFKSMMIFVSRNSLVENAPKKLYNYWQLVRFGEDKVGKVSSSKFKKNTLITDDFLFEREVEIQVEDPNNNKILMKNYSDFQDTLMNDVKFLSKICAKKFSLLMMYYEFENIKPVDSANQTPMSGPGEDKRTAESIQSNFMMETPDLNSNLNVGTQKNEFFPGLEDVSKIDGGTVMEIKAGNLFDYSEQVSITGYEGKFDQFKCMTFFIFENLYEIGGGLKMTNFYDKFGKKVLSYFVDYSNK